MLIVSEDVNLRLTGGIQMMKLAVIAANGKTGQRVVETALAHDLDVTAIVRHENRSQAT